MRSNCKSVVFSHLNHSIGACYVWDQNTACKPLVLDRWVLAAPLESSFSLQHIWDVSPHTKIRTENQRRSLLGLGESGVFSPDGKMNVININDYKFLKSSFRAQQILNY